jgi:hyperosmotically inducible periplasmic protein
MKTGAIALLSLILVGSVFAAQNTDTKPAKVSKPKATQTIVDCSKTNDATITANVKEKLSKTASLKDLMIDVATTGGVVTLTGSVKTGANKGLATRQVKRVSCVKQADNQLTVEKKAASPQKAENKKKQM